MLFLFALWHLRAMCALSRTAMHRIPLIITAAPVQIRRRLVPGTGCLLRLVIRCAVSSLLLGGISDCSRTLVVRRFHFVLVGAVLRGGLPRLFVHILGLAGVEVVIGGSRALQVGSLANNWLGRTVRRLHVISLVGVCLVVLLVEVAQASVIVGRVRALRVRYVIVRVGDP